MLEWVALSFSRGPSPSRIELLFLALAGRFFTREAFLIEQGPILGCAGENKLD